MIKWSEEITTLEAQLEDVIRRREGMESERLRIVAEIEKARAAFAPIRIGDLASSRRGAVYRVTRVRLAYGDNWHVDGVRRLKNGSFGTTVHRLWTEWTPVQPSSSGGDK